MKIFIQKDINKLHEHITQKGLQSKPIEIVTNQNIASSSNMEIYNLEP